MKGLDRYLQAPLDEEARRELLFDEWRDSEAFTDGIDFDTYAHLRSEDPR